MGTGSAVLSVIQAVGRCCSDGYGVQVVVWSDPDTRKATASYLYIHTQPLYQAAGRTRLEESLERRVMVMGSIPRDFKQCAHSEYIDQCNVADYND